MAVGWQEVYEMAAQLPPEEQTLLIEKLRLSQPSVVSGAESLRDQLLREAAALRLLPPKPEDRLMGKYAADHVREADDDTLIEDLRATATEWEAELDEFFGDTP